ncbi:hypothetical protein LOK49_LG08G02755 [Camellia lanceoleosa]|uniref:Uncharacterized protein n=1 Tax=Camellia lanceoleosa TaxID=1840588 RepID=A0ACC0GSN5_9ERIC|nr:hypothetical protein LOK49_LG08G02755 [Camellia lanceoleosa]
MVLRLTPRIAGEARLLQMQYTKKNHDVIKILEKRGAKPLMGPMHIRRKELRKTGRGKQVPPEEPKPPRETHKLLQVLGETTKRKKLLSPKGMDVRLMMEVVKGAVFNILQTAGGCPASLRPGRWLDLYSGTGSVGIEALSWRCSEIPVLKPRSSGRHFPEASSLSPYCIRGRSCRYDLISNGPFDYISVTPPYIEVDYGVLMDQVSKSSVVGEDTFIVVEYPLRTDMLDSCGCLIKISDRQFGRTHLAIYGPKWAQKKRKLEKSVWALARKGINSNIFLF